MICLDNHAKCQCRDLPSFVSAPKKRSLRSHRPEGGTCTVPSGQVRCVLREEDGKGAGQSMAVTVFKCVNFAPCQLHENVARTHWSAGHIVRRHRLSLILRAKFVNLSCTASRQDAHDNAQNSSLENCPRSALSPSRATEMPEIALRPTPPGLVLLQQRHVVHSPVRRLYWET